LWRIGFASKNVFFAGLALLRKAFTSCWIGFPLQSQSIVTDWLCFAKPIHRGGYDLLRKANMFRWIGFAKQSHPIVLEYCGLALRSKANPM
jgi:hypothetical protein